MTQDRLKIAIADEGDGFDPKTLPDPLAPERLCGDSGRGVYLSRALMDEYHVRSCDAGGTEVTLVKDLRPQGTDPCASESGAKRLALAANLFARSPMRLP